MFVFKVYGDWFLVDKEDREVKFYLNEFSCCKFIMLLNKI